MNSSKILIISIGLLFFYYGVIACTGYGNDDDTYRMIRSGINLIFNHIYEPSRFQGSLVPELSIGFLSKAGGFYLSNAVSVMMSITVLILYYLVVKRTLSLEKALLAMLLIGFNPYFVIVSSSSMDYIYNLFFMMLGGFLLTKRYYTLAAVMLALALSSRLSTALLIFLIYLYFIISEAKSGTDSIKKITLLSLLTQKASYSAMFSLVLTVILYLPVYIVSDYSFSFLTHYDPEFGWVGHVSRVIYYNMSILGGFLAVLVFLFTTPYKRFWNFIRKEPNLAIIFMIIAMIIVELVFIRLPYEQEFLLPLLFLLIPLYLYFSRSLIPAYLILALTVLSNVVNIDVLDVNYITLPNGDIEAEDARIALVVKPGIVVEDVRTRDASAEKYRKRFQLQDLSSKPAANLH